MSISNTFFPFAIPTFICTTLVMWAYHLLLKLFWSFDQYKVVFSKNTRILSRENFVWKIQLSAYPHVIYRFTGQSQCCHVVLINFFIATQKSQYHTILWFRKNLMFLYLWLLSIAQKIPCLCYKPCQVRTLPFGAVVADVSWSSLNCADLSTGEEKEYLVLYRTYQQSFLVFTGLATTSASLNWKNA